MQRVEEAQRGFLGARAAWFACTEKGRAQKKARDEWNSKKRHLEQMTKTPHDHIRDEFETLGNSTFSPKRLTLSVEEAVGITEQLFESVNQAVDELVRLAPPPPAEPVDDGTVFYKAYVEARVQLEEALDKLVQEDPKIDKKREMERILKQAV